MSGALNSVIGGGGGGLLSAIGGVIGGAFGGPIGAMIGQAVGNLLQDAVGEAISGAVNQLQEKHGMPKFVGDAFKESALGALSAQRNNSVSADLQTSVKGEIGGSLDKFKTRLEGSIVDHVLAEVKISKRGDDDSGDGSGGWLQAIAKAMGKVLGDKAAHMVELSQDMAELNGKIQGASGSNKDQDTKNATAFNQKMTDFQATSQEYSILNNTFSTAIKAIGEAMGSMARKQ